MNSKEEYKFSFEGVGEGNVASLIEIQLGKFATLPSSFRTRTSETLQCRTTDVRDVVIVDKNFNGLLIKQAHIESVKYVVVNEDQEREYIEKTKGVRPFRNIIGYGLR
jgi:hypothetical protein